MTNYKSLAVLVLAALAGSVNGYTMNLASNPTNVRDQWGLPNVFGGVTIPGARISESSVYGYYNNEEDDDDIFYSPLQPIDPRSKDAFENEHGNSGYEPIWNSRSRSRNLLALSSVPPSPLSAGSVWRQNNNRFGKNTNSFVSHLGRGNRSFSRGTPALSMANYMQNGGSNRNNRSNRDNRNNSYNNRNNSYNRNNNNREYNDSYNDSYNNNYSDDYSSNYGRDDYDYDDRSRSYNNDYGSPRGGRPRGTNRFNTVGSVGNVNGSNVSRSGRSMQFQNRRDSNIAGRAGRTMDDSFSQFAPDNNSRFESRRPNDNYARGGYRQDSRTGHWTDPNSNYNINESPRPTYSTDNRYTSSSSRNGFRPSSRGYERGRYGAGGNVPYDSDYYDYNNYESQDYEDYGDTDFYSRNGNIMNNRRGSRGNSPGRDQNYYNVDSNRRMDRGGGLMRYRPNNQRPDGGYYGNGYDYEVGGYDDFYDSSGSFYNSEGKRVRRFDAYYDRNDGYYNPDHLSNDFTDPDRILQNERRRNGRDVQTGASLRRYDPEWDGQQGLYDEASLYGSETKGTRGFNYGYGDSMDNPVVSRRRRRGNSEDPSLLGGGWGETGGRNRYSRRSNYGDYQEGDYIEDGYDRGQARFNRQGDRYRQNSGRDDYDTYGSSRRNLGRRDRDSERDYYRSGDYRGPDLRGDDSMERFRQGKDVRKTDLYSYETNQTPSNRKRVRRSKKNRVRPGMSEGRTVNGSYNSPGMGAGRTVNGSYNRGRGGGRINGSAGRDRGMSLDDLNEML